MPELIRVAFLLNEIVRGETGPGAGVDNLLLGDGSSNFLLGDGASVILLV